MQIKTAPKKKVCMVGDFAVGKTSLTQKFVNNVFSDKYLTTVGVKIDTVELGDTKLVIWDIAGRDSIAPINLNYLVGAAGIVLVADGTRQSTIESIPNILQQVKGVVGDVACVIAINKSDSEDWQVSDQQLQNLSDLKLPLIRTSAKNNNNIEKLFATLIDLFIQ